MHTCIVGMYIHTYAYATNSKASNDNYSKYVCEKWSYVHMIFEESHAALHPTDCK